MTETALNIEAANYDDFTLPFHAHWGRCDIDYSGYAIHQDLIKREQTHLIVVDTDKAAYRLQAQLQFFSQRQVIVIPGWDCLPYDRAAPHVGVMQQRLKGLYACLQAKQKGEAVVVIATAAAMVQRVPPPEFVLQTQRVIKQGEKINFHEFAKFLVGHGYGRVDTVREPGEFAVRGDIFDVFPVTEAQPYRLDVFDDEIENMRLFDALSQRTTGEATQLSLQPRFEFLLKKDAVERFRQRYREIFGNDVITDPIYEAVSEQRYMQGMEHWLPLMHAKMHHLSDYVEAEQIFWLPHTGLALKNIATQIVDYYQARVDDTLSRLSVGDDKVAIWRPLPPDHLYVPLDELLSITSEFKHINVTTADQVDTDANTYKPGKALLSTHLYNNAASDDLSAKLQGTVDYIKAAQSEKKSILLAMHSKGSGERLIDNLKEQFDFKVERVDHLQDLKKGQVAWSPLLFNAGFISDDIVVVSETLIHGAPKLGHATRQKRDASNILNSLADISPDDIVVHAMHGLGRYEKIITMDTQGVKHDCLLIHYAGNDKLYLPVENLDMLSRYDAGGANDNLQLDKLGSTAWQMRKAKARKKIRDIAAKLIKIAAKRLTQKAEVVVDQVSAYEGFIARFPYAETDDQLAAIHDVITDLSSGQPMDRLVCGDVGFGKTEVALRAAFLVAMQGYQVAIVAPTTLLARQHYENFVQRFKGFPIKLAQLSRLVSASKVKQTKEALQSGDIDIVIGTHAVLGKNIEFARLGLVIVDEEQHFGVVQKSRLQNLKHKVHSLTLSATPIPRTMQQALNGIRSLSIIATPPVDRLAINTFVSQFDQVMVKEAILREYARGGQTFYVCPRISDLVLMEERVKQMVPDLSYGIAHGQMAVKEIERVIQAFIDGEIDILLSTQIVESGLDIPRANTMIVHRADRFGLAQLYQLRGRVGRSKIQAYAYLTAEHYDSLPENGKRRLSVMQTLDHLGAGFEIAQHDMDIRGAGNILGEEQSGHIKEVGMALYQHMLNEEIERLKSERSKDDEEVERSWSPQLNLGVPVLIPEDYIPSLKLRLHFYQRIANVDDGSAIEAMAAEMIDRFGELPDGVNNLLKTMHIKLAAKKAHVEKIDVGTKGIVVKFFEDSFPKPEALIGMLSEHAAIMKLRPDHRLVISQIWRDPQPRLQAILEHMEQLAAL